MQRSGQRRDVAVLPVQFVEFAGLAKHPDHVEAESVGLAFFDGGCHVSQRIANCALPVYRILDPETMRNLVKHFNGEEGVEIYVLPLGAVDQHVGDRFENRLELGPHRIS